jgi:hypothetical protein
VTTFHLANGLYFERMQNGNIKIRVEHVEPSIEAPNGFKTTVLFEVETDVDGFASVMACMSARNESFDTWNEARSYLLREPK